MDICKKQKNTKSINLINKSKFDSASLKDYLASFQSTNYDVQRGKKKVISFGELSDVSISESEMSEKDNFTGQRSTFLKKNSFEETLVTNEYLERRGNLTDSANSKLNQTSETCVSNHSTLIAEEFRFGRNSQLTPTDSLSVIEKHQSPMQICLKKNEVFPNRSSIEIPSVSSPKHYSYDCSIHLSSREISENENLTSILHKNQCKQSDCISKSSSEKSLVFLNIENLEDSSTKVKECFQEPYINTFVNDFEYLDDFESDYEEILHPKSIPTLNLITQSEKSKRHNDKSYSKNFGLKSNLRKQKKIHANEQDNMFCDAQTSTETSDSFDTLLLTAKQAGWYNRTAFSAAVTAAVNKITANQEKVKPVTSSFISKNALDSLISYNPCVTALENILRQQLQITKDFLKSHAQLHDVLTNAIQNCFTPSMPYEIIK